MKTFILFITLLFVGCLNAKKSPFDLNTPSGLFGGFIFATFAAGTTIGGNITGFTSGEIVLQLNNGSDITIKFPATTYSAGTISRGTEYALKIKSNPTGLVCKIANATGKVTANVTNADITCTDFIISSMYSTNGVKWNGYINRDFSKDIFSQTDTPCNAANTGGYKTCIHAGEIRKFDFSSRTACTNLTAKENIGALNWICKANSTTGGVTFYSSSLKTGKYLSDLIDWTSNAWQSLTITVTEANTTLSVSNPTKLWTNVIDISQPAAPNVSETLYLYDLSTITNSIIISADKILVVINPNGIKSIRTNGACNGIAGIDISNRNYVWFEGSMDFGNSTVNAYGILLSGSKFSVLKNAKVQNAGKNCVAGGEINSAIYLNNTSNNYIENIVLSSTLGTSPANGIGLRFSNSDANMITGLSISNMPTDGIQLNTSKKNIIMNAIVMSSAAECVLIQTASHDNSILNISTTNTNNFGIRSTGSNNGLYINTVLFNHQNHGIDLITGSSITLQNLAASNNPTGQVNLNTSSSYFTGIVKTSTSTCLYSASSGGMDSSCLPISPSDFTPQLSISSIANTFVGYAATDGKNTTTGLSGNASGQAFVTMTDWVSFDHLFKGIGKFNALAYPSTTHLGVCNGSNPCTIWDLSLKSGDTVLRNVNINGTGASCPTSTLNHTFTSGTIVTFLRNSVEILNDGIGNDNGFCEANEDCLLTPNIGAYQGHGSIVSSSTLSGGCADVTSKGIKLYQYETNGY